MAKDLGVIAGQGWVFEAKPDTPAPVSLAGFDPFSPAVAGFEWIGETSKENVVQFSKEGGEVTTLSTWGTPNMRSIKSDETWTVSIHSVALTAGTLARAFPSGEWDAAGKFDVKGTSNTETKSILIVMKDNVTGYVGVHFPRGSLGLGDVPTLNTEGFTEVPLTLTALTSESTGVVMSWILPSTLHDGAPQDAGDGDDEDESSDVG